MKVGDAAMVEQNKKVKPADMIISTGDLAEIIGKTKQWVINLNNNGILHKVERGKYILGASVRAYIEYVTSSSQEDNGKAKQVNEKAELTRLQKEKAQLELEKMRGELYRADEIDMMFTNMILTIKAKLQALPVRTSPMLEGESRKEIERILREEVDAILISMANHDPGGRGS
jgi:phage terminase Nu1 subunit (DNA packaging protein)